MIWYIGLQLYFYYFQGAGGFLASHALASTHDVIHCALGVSSFYDLRYQGE